MMSSSDVLCQGRQSYEIITSAGPRSFSPDGGYVLPHEHILCDVRAWFEDGDLTVREMDDAALLAAQLTLDPDDVAVDVPFFDALRRHPAAVARENLILSDWVVMAKELRYAVRSGCQLLVDLTNVGMHPMPELATRAARAAGLDVVLPVGRYLHNTLVPNERARSTEDLVDEWLRAASSGLDGYSVGVIGEIGTSEVITPAELISLEAAAEVQRQTGLAINVHLHVQARQGHRVLDVLDASGADLARVALSHNDGESEIDVDWVEGLLARGCYVEFDLFGREDWAGLVGAFPTDRTRMDAVCALCERGHAGGLLLSHDIALRSTLKRYGGWGYDHLATNILPLLESRLGQAPVYQMTRVNPLEFLAVP
jgi:phosphotriesterase-related protein